MKKLNIKNFEDIKDKETEHLTICDAKETNSKYIFTFQQKGIVSASGEVTISRYESKEYPDTYHLEVCWKTRNRLIYAENVMNKAFKQKSDFFRKLDKIIIERIN